jgi:hypothetical protein
MARRGTKSADDSGLGALLVLGGLILAKVLSFLLPVFVTAAAYLGLPYLLARLFLVERQNRLSPELSVPDYRTFEEVRRAIRDVAYVTIKATTARNDLFELGEQSRVQLVEEDGRMRFDKRSSKGRELNEYLGKLNRLIAERSEMVTTAKANLRADVPHYREIKEFLVQIKARAFSLKLALFAYVAAFMATLFGSPGARALSASVFFAVQPLQPFYGPAAVALVLSLIVAYFGCWIAAYFLRPRTASAYENSWDTYVEEIAHSDDLPDDYRPPQQDAAGTRGAAAPADRSKLGHGAQDEPVRRTQAWHEILGVGASAAPDEIKTAWRSAVAKYHPDNVARLGPKLRELAEHETRDINAAYQQARKLGRV